jgi:hypothetical protein
MYELKTEREQLMKKVDAQSNYIKKADTTAKTHAKQLLDQNKRIKQLEEEIQHVKTTKMIDKLAHKNIHGPREKGHMSEEETYNKKVSDDNLSETTQRSEQIKKTTKNVKSNSNKLSIAQPHFSKLSTYDGSGDWKSYHLQFTHTALRFEWTDAQQLDNFLLCLRGKALKFFSARPQSVQHDFKLMMEKMFQRFGNKDLPHSIRKQLQDVKQNVEESIEELVEKVQ